MGSAGASGGTGMNRVDSLIAGGVGVRAVDSDLESGSQQEIIIVNLLERVAAVVPGSLADLERDSRERFYAALNQGIETLGKAKAQHDRLEEYYAPYVDFQRVNRIRDQIIEEIEAIE